MKYPYYMHTCSIFFFIFCGDFFLFWEKQFEKGKPCYNFPIFREKIIHQKINFFQKKHLLKKHLICRPKT